jgi:hypothetical protein
MFAARGGCTFAGWFFFARLYSLICDRRHSQAIARATLNEFVKRCPLATQDVGQAARVSHKQGENRTKSAQRPRGCGWQPIARGKVLRSVQHAKQLKQTF